MECVNPITQLVDKTKETEILLGKSVKMKVEISPKMQRFRKSLIQHLIQMWQP